MYLVLPLSKLAVGDTFTKAKGSTKFRVIDVPLTIYVEGAPPIPVQTPEGSVLVEDVRSFKPTFLSKDREVWLTLSEARDCDLAIEYIERERDACIDF